MTIPALLGLGGSLLGGLFGSSAQSDTNQMQMDLAQKQMDFQERMSGSAYQRGMADMRKAGLNPMLAFAQGGASSPAGAMAGLTAPTQFGQSVGQGVSSAMAAMQLAKQLDLIDAQKAKTLNDAMVSNADFVQRQIDIQARGATDPVTHKSIEDKLQEARLASAQWSASSAQSMARLAQRDAQQGTSRLGRGLNWVDAFRKSFFGGSNPSSAAGAVLPAVMP